MIDIDTLAAEIQSDSEQRYEQLINLFPERLETDSGYETTIDWGEYISDYISSHCSDMLDMDEHNDLLEEVREVLCV